MSTTRDGGPAFPAQRPEPVTRMGGGLEMKTAHYLGMTLRDWLAGQALTAALPAFDSESRFGGPSKAEAAKAAAWAYCVADAMLAAREGVKP